MTRSGRRGEGDDPGAAARLGRFPEVPWPVAALVPVGAALAAQAILWDVIRPYAWFLFFPAVFAAARWGGLRAGLGATLAATAVVWWFFIPPEGALDKAGHHYFAAAAFIGIGVAIGVYNERLRRADDALRAANARITDLYERTLALDRMKSRVIANVSHELRTPLTLILGPTERMLAATPGSDDRHRQLEVVHRNARLLLGHVEDLLDVASLEAGEARLHPAEVDLVALTGYVCGCFADAAADRRMTIDVRTDPAVVVHADPERMQRVLMNLVANAVAFTPDGGTIRVEARLDPPDGAVLEVADSGPGVPDDRREEIFERFRQLDDAATRRVGGTGLGLSIVREFVALHGGTVTVGDAPEGGASFVVRIPVAAPRPAAAAGTDPAPVVRTGAVVPAAARPRPAAPVDEGAEVAGDGAALVLVVEDDPDMNRFLCESLRGDHRVAAASDGASGLARARELRPDLILTDVMMPGVSGEEVLAAVRDIPGLEAVPVVVLTARADEALRVALLRAGAADVLTKPFSAEELRARIGNIIAATRATAALRAGEAVALDIARRSRAAQDRAERLLDSAPDAMVVVDGEGRIRIVNRETEELFGYARSELIGRHVEVLLPEAAREGHVGRRARFLGDPRARRMGAGLDLVGRRSDGTEVPIDVALSPLRIDGETLVTAAVRDIGERRAMETRLKMHAERFRATFADAPIGMALMDLRPDGTSAWIDVNEALCGTLGYGREELLALAPESLVHPDDRGDEGLRRVASGALGRHETERRYRHAAGRDVWIRLSVSGVAGAGGERGFAVVHFQDVTTRRQAETELAHAALHDGLTGLANRTMLLDRLGQRLSEVGRDGGLVAVLYIDLDRFKAVNDTFGHAAGDQLLIEIARRLETLVRPGDTAARIAGDEFVVVAPDIESENAARRLAERLLRELGEPLRVDGHSMRPSVSIGVTVTGESTRRPDDLLRAADVALYQAKRRGGHRIQMQDAARAHLAARASEAEADILHALEHDRLVLHYQPILAVADGSLVMAEALLRLDHPTRGLLTPDAFLDAAESSGLIVPAGTWVIREACRRLAAWQGLGGRTPGVSVNVSARQVAHGDLGEVVDAALATSGADPRGLWLEITESIFTEAGRSVVRTLREIRARGVRLALDDFGTGYSSLAYLKRFPVDLIKIDRGFTAGLGVHHDDTAIIDAITGLGRSLGLEVVAEGVETPAQLATLRSMGCTFVQGHLFARAGEAAAIEDLIRNGSGVT